MDLHSSTLKFWSPAEGVSHFVGLTLYVHKLKPVLLHFLDPASLPMREMGRGILQQILEWGMIRS